jgi:hypothetical protein
MGSRYSASSIFVEPAVLLDPGDSAVNDLRIVLDGSECCRALMDQLMWFVSRRKISYRKATFALVLL